MPKSVRVSDELYQTLERERRLMQRSIGAQLEYLARLGLAVEQSPHLTARDLHALLQSREPVDQSGTESLEGLFDRLSQLGGNPALMDQLHARGDDLETIEENVRRRPQRHRKAG